MRARLLETIRSHRAQATHDEAHASPRKAGNRTVRAESVRCLTSTSDMSFNDSVDETLTIRLDAETAAALADEARRTSRSKGRIVREALAEHLRGKRVNALQGLAKYAGCMKGPPDLSTNKRYLAGLGGRRRQ